MSDNLWHDLCKNGWTDRDAVWVVDLGWLNEACVTCKVRTDSSTEFGSVRSNFGWIVRPLLTWGGTLVPRGEYDWTIRVWRRCGLMSNYFDHLLCFFIHKYVYIKYHGFSNKPSRSGYRINNLVSLCPLNSFVNTDAINFFRLVGQLQFNSALTCKKFNLKMLM